MNTKTIHQLISGNGFPDCSEKIELIETHISWVLLGNEMVYKIKKPVVFSFLDFSTLENRHHFCQREYELNRRLAPDMYLGIVAITERNGHFFIGSNKGQIIDYAVCMKRMDHSKQMDILLEKNEVTTEHIEKIAEQLGHFHKQAKRYFDVAQVETIHEKFADLSSVANFLGQHFGRYSEEFIKDLIQFSALFTWQHSRRFRERMELGFMVDGHGDLHSRNIFLLEEPVIFDCIEFNDDYRHLDVLSDIAFFCMDLDYRKNPGLSRQFLQNYLAINSCMPLPEDESIFQYYKLFRANVRLKVSALEGIQQEKTGKASKQLLSEIRAYLNLMEHYYSEITSLHI